MDYIPMFPLPPQPFVWTPSPPTPPTPSPTPSPTPPQTPPNSKTVAITKILGLGLGLYLTLCILRMELLPPARNYQRDVYPNWNPVARKILNLDDNTVADHSLPLAEHHDLGENPLLYFFNIFSDYGKPGKYQSVDEIKASQYIPELAPQPKELAIQQGNLLGQLRAQIEKGQTMSKTYNLFNEMYQYYSAKSRNPHLFTSTNTVSWNPGLLNPEYVVDLQRRVKRFEQLAARHRKLKNLSVDKLSNPSD